MVKCHNNDGFQLTECLQYLHSFRVEKLVKRLEDIRIGHFVEHISFLRLLLGLFLMFFAGDLNCAFGDLERSSDITGVSANFLGNKSQTIRVKNFLHRL